MMRRRPWIVICLLAVLAAAATLRAPGVYWGDGDLIPERFVHWHPDEITHVRMAEQFLKNDVDYGADYVKGFAVHIVLAAAAVRPFVESLSKNDLYRIGRWLSLIYGLGIVLLVYIALYRISGNQGVALLAAALMGLNGLGITQSHFATSDSASVFWMWMTAILAYAAVSRGSRPAMLGAWAACGVAVAVKVALAAFAPLVVMHWAGFRKPRHMVLGAMTLTTVFLAANGFGLGAEGFLAIAQKLLFDNVQVIPQHSFLETLTAVAVSLPPAFSLPVLVLAVTGLVLAPRKNWIIWGLFASPALAHLFLVMFLDDPFERHLLPLAPVVSGLAAWGWWKLLDGTRRPLLWSAPLAAYLLFFAIEGERPFWRDNRINARQWIINEVDGGASILQGPYAKLKLPKKKYKVTSFNRWSKKVPDMEGFDLIVLHEAHTYRYARSRLSPWRRPEADNIYHPDKFSLSHLEALQSGLTPFKLVKPSHSLTPWTWERALYKRYFGTFQSFSGDLYIYRKG
ncbi:MAG TPA: phospholipid carrier-dependent glycosyltransferase [Rhodospirillales bacterium]|nr:phospholipid carrier-dependent glycosyltransferase [Rhodospirillales bacterium]